MGGWAQQRGAPVVELAVSAPRIRHKQQNSRKLRCGQTGIESAGGRRSRARHTNCANTMRARWVAAALRVAAALATGMVAAHGRQTLGRAEEWPRIRLAAALKLSGLPVIELNYAHRSGPSNYRPAKQIRPNGRRLFLPRPERKESKRARGRQSARNSKQ